jgi:hypothetical protein
MQVLSMKLATVAADALVRAEASAASGLHASKCRRASSITRVTAAEIYRCNRCSILQPFELNNRGAGDAHRWEC